MITKKYKISPQQSWTIASGRYDKDAEEADNDANKDCALI
jgi:hypothetical protein